MSQNVDCVCFCPIKGYEHYLICARYQLDTKSNLVHGGFEIYDTATNSLNKIYQEDSEGIFDLMWLPDILNSSVYFLVAYACPKIALYSFDLNEGIKKVDEKNFEDKLKFLYIDCLVINNEGHVLIVDDSLQIYYFKIDQSLSHALIKHKGDHIYTIWCANFTSFSTNMIMSGGDDARLNLYDLRVDSENPIQVLKSNKRSHEAGVCCIAFNKADPNYFLTGSYDEYIRLWDIRKFEPRSDPIDNFNLEGGVWRVKINPIASEYIGCAAMRNHFQILKLKDKSNFALEAIYKEHESLCYGIDWKNLNEKDSCYSLASCSFYDNYLTYWKFNP